MIRRPWDDVLTPTDRIVIEKGGYGKPRGLGASPCLMIIDPQYNYVGDDAPIEEQLDRWPSGGGSRAWAAIRNIQPLLRLAREVDIPVIFTRNVQKKSVRFDGFARKTARSQEAYIDGHPGTRIVDELKPLDGELVIDKSYASVFYGTPIATFLVQLKVDTLLVTGGSTGGCVRATVVDAITRGWNVAVIEDCTFDRIDISHKAALLDMWMKYCDVIRSDEAEAYLKAVASRRAAAAPDPASVWTPAALGEGDAVS